MPEASASPYSSPPPIAVLLQQPPGQPKWTEEVQVIATPIVAIVAAVIATSVAYAQWRTAKRKLKLDLFDKRLGVFRATVQLIDMMAEDRSSGEESVKLLLSELIGAGFLFNERVERYLAEEIVCKASRILSIQSNRLDLIREGKRDEAKELESEADKLRQWFGQQFEVFKEKTAGYLRVTH